MMGEAAMATCGMDPTEVNGIVEKIVFVYEKDYRNAPEGMAFQDCYDTNDIVPSDRYLDVYESALATLSQCGIDF